MVSISSQSLVVRQSSLRLLQPMGKDADEIHAMHMCLLEMAAQLKLPVVALIVDEAASELSVQGLMNQEKNQPPFIYENPAYGIRLLAAVNTTGPLISVTDPPYAQNQPQHGTYSEP